MGIPFVRAARKQSLQRLDAALHVADVDALRRIPAVWMEKVVLRVDDDERRAPRHQVPVRRLKGRGLPLFPRHRLPFRRLRAVRCGERITRLRKV